MLCVPASRAHRGERRRECCRPAQWASTGALIFSSLGRSRYSVQCCARVNVGVSERRGGDGGGSSSAGRIQARGRRRWADRIQIQAGRREMHGCCSLHCVLSLSVCLSAESQWWLRRAEGNSVAAAAGARASSQQRRRKSNPTHHEDTHAGTARPIADRSPMQRRDLAVTFPHCRARSRVTEQHHGLHTGRTSA